MIHSASKAFFHLLARIGPLQSLASRYGMRDLDQLRAPLHRRRDDRRSDCRGPHRRVARLSAHPRLPGRKRHEPGGGRRSDPRLSAHHRCGDCRRHRPQSLAEADPARARRRPRQCDRQPAQDLRPRSRASSSGSTWRARPTPRSRSTSSRRSGITATATWGSCCRPS